MPYARVRVFYGVTVKRFRNDTASADPEPRTHYSYSVYFTERERLWPCTIRYRFYEHLLYLVGRLPLRAAMFTRQLAGRHETEGRVHTAVRTPTHRERTACQNRQNPRVAGFSKTRVVCHHATSAVEQIERRTCKCGVTRDRIALVHRTLKSIWAYGNYYGERIVFCYRKEYPNAVRTWKSSLQTSVFREIWNKIDGILKISV